MSCDVGSLVFKFTIEDLEYLYKYRLFTRLEENYWERCVSPVDDLHYGRQYTRDIPKAEIGLCTMLLSHSRVFDFYLNTSPEDFSASTLESLIAKATGTKVTVYLASDDEYNKSDVKTS